ncbi:MAG: hypothetical protein V7719_13480 [Psychroserpens sp.]|uniref:hypothetical protein n=1 Tax=Psychroserpens sp. TaxID=2020870 RepID=UPI0030030153
MEKFKIILIFVLISIFSIPTIIAQTIPQGMKYQAIARTSDGDLIKEKPISMMISLQSNDASKAVHYIELHDTTTNMLGLFSLTIGQGEVSKGEFNKIPWSTEDIWMEIAIKTDEGDFKTLSSTKLLAVPYAFHAATASKLDNGVKNKIGVPSQTWSLFGNLNSDALIDKLGTTDSTDLVVVTNNIERLRITADGRIITGPGKFTMGGNLEVQGDSTRINKDLFVGRDVVLNFDEGFSPRGETINHGNFTVRNMSSTLLTGTLNVNKATDLDDILNVDGETDLNSALRVNNASATNLTGLLNVDGETDLNSALRVNNASATNLTGLLNVDGETDLNSELRVNNASATDLTGTLNVDGETDLNSAFRVNNSSSTNLTGTLNVTAATTLSSTLAANGQVTINTNVAGGQTSYGAYPLRVEGSAQGVAIKLNASTPNNDNNFITFFNSSGSAVGRIEGETQAELRASSEYQWQEGLVIAEEVKAAADVALAFIPMPGVGVVAVATVCVPCVAMAAADLVLTTINLADFYVHVDANYGVTYQSGSADYAEWLERQNPSEKIVAGEIVGVYGGKISKYTKDARQFMVISTKPAMLGNMPEEGQEGNYEKVAFMGQIPVRVRGFVIEGDYILPSGLNDGTGIAISPKEIKTNQLANIVGVAWSSSYSEGVISTINMAIGLNSNDVANVVEQQELRLTDLEARLIALETGTEYIPKAPVKAQKTRAEIMAENMPAELSDEVMEDAIIYLKEQYTANGIDYNKYPALKKVFTDKAYQSEIIKKTQETYKANYKLIMAREKTRN